MKTKLFLILILFVLVVPNSLALYARANDLRPTIEEYEGEPLVYEGETIIIPRTIYVENVNNISVIVEFEPVGNFEKMIELVDKQVILQPGESTRAKYNVLIKSAGTYEGRILVTFKAEDPESKEMPIGLSARLLVKVDGDENDFYEEVMGEDSEDEDDDDGFSLGDFFNRDDDEDSDDETDNSDSGNQDKKSKTNVNKILTLVLLGLLILVSLVVIFFVVKKFIK